MGFNMATRPVLLEIGGFSEGSISREYGCSPPQNERINGLLKQNFDGGFTLAKAEVTDEDLDFLSLNSQLPITSVTSGLSLVSPSKMIAFLEVFGSRIQSFAIKNNSYIYGADFAKVCSLLPNIRSISLVYQHTLKDEDVYNGLRNCCYLESITLNANPMLTYRLFHRLLGIDFHLSNMTFSDYNQNAKVEERFSIRASVQVLNLIGNGFQKYEDTVMKIHGLHQLALRETKVNAEQLAHLLEKEGLGFIEVHNGSSRDPLIETRLLKCKLSKLVSPDYVDLQIDPSKGNILKIKKKH